VGVVPLSCGTTVNHYAQGCQTSYSDSCITTNIPTLDGGCGPNNVVLEDLLTTNVVALQASVEQQPLIAAVDAWLGLKMQCIAWHRLLASALLVDMVKDGADCIQN